MMLNNFDDAFSFEKKIETLQKDEIQEEHIRVKTFQEKKQKEISTRG